MYLRAAEAFEVRQILLSVSCHVGNGNRDDIVPRQISQPLTFPLLQYKSEQSLNAALLIPPNGTLWTHLGSLLYALSQSDWSSRMLPHRPTASADQRHSAVAASSRLLGLDAGTTVHVEPT